MTSVLIIVHRRPDERQLAAVPGAALVGRNAVAVGGEGGPYEIVLGALRRMEAVGLRPMRIDAQDWATLDLIGTRVGRSRETVRAWACGSYGPGDFPPPLNIGGTVALFSWAEVHRWLLNHPELGVTVPTGREEPVLPALNLAVQLRTLVPYLSRPAAVVELLRGAVRPETARSGSTYRVSRRSF